jgi:formate dehydrogenase major subunit
MNMKKNETETFKVILNNKECTACKGETILSALKRNGWEVPTLCHGDGLEPFAGCSICSVEVKGKPKLMASCSTPIEPGMEIVSESKRVYDARKSCLELLLSNHYGDCMAPCTLECPANIDIQGYLAHAANGDYREALKLIKEKNPMPRTIGRVCPHTCESKCRRNLVDEPLAINPVKRFVADWDAEHAPAFRPARKRPTGKKIAVIGAGPSGLSAAYYLAVSGHEVEIFERLPKAGGMLRYGIPRYRLPAKVLDWEIENILSLGIKLHTECEFNETFNLAALEKQGFEAVYISIGAHSSTSMRIHGEKLEGVVAGIDFLRELEINGAYPIGRNVVVVGGGNTAIDTARTALRMGCEKVSVYYRRTEKEMPAEDYEVRAAKEEGIEFNFLAAPVKAMTESGTTESGQLAKVSFIKMELGEPDASGRRRPVPIEGSEFDVQADTLIAAIGQKPESALAVKAGLKVNSWGGIDADEFTGLGNGYEEKSSTDSGAACTPSSCSPDACSGCSCGAPALSGPIKVFAGGDCVTGAATAIKGIGAGRRSAETINAALLGLEIPDHGMIVRKGELDEMPAEEFAEYEKIERAEIPELEPETRKKSFIESELTMTEDTILKEAARCLECGCEKLYSCQLKKWADQSEIQDVRYSGEMTKIERVLESGLIERDRNKCILCNKCVRTCSEVVGLTALGLSQRGFATTVEPAMHKALCDTDCNFCGMCIDACPTQALAALVPLRKPGPFKTETIDTKCGLCPAACPVRIEVSGNKIISVTGYDSNKSHENTKDSWTTEVCALGRFSHRNFNDDDRSYDLKDKIKTFAADLKTIVKNSKKDRPFNILLSKGIGDKALESIKGLTEKLGFPEVITAGVPAITRKNSSGMRITGPVKFMGNSKISPVTFKELDFESPKTLVIAVGVDLGDTSPVLAGTLRSHLLKGGSLISINSDLSKRVNKDTFKYCEGTFDKLISLIKGDEVKCQAPERLQTAESVIVLAGKDLDAQNSDLLIDAIDKKAFRGDAFMVPVHSYTNLQSIIAAFGDSSADGPDFAYMPSDAPRANEEFADFKKAAMDMISNHVSDERPVMLLSGEGILLKTEDRVESMQLLPLAISGETATDIMGCKVAFNSWYGSKALSLNEALNAIAGNL